MTNLALKIATLDQNKLSDLREFLNTLKEHFRAEGVILWELDTNTSQLFVLSDTFNNEVHPPLPLNDSKTGKAILEKKPIYVNDLSTAVGYFSKTKFWEDRQIVSFLTIPINFLNGELGAINLYSKTPNHFSKEDYSDIISCAKILPNWYCSLLDRATFGLLQRIEKIIKQAEIELFDALVTKPGMQKYIELICREVADFFQCLEVSIVLKDGVKKDVDIFERIAATWIHPESRSIYQKSLDHGITGWILVNEKPVQIVDLYQFDDLSQRRMIDQRYPRLKFSLSESVKRAFFEETKYIKYDFRIPMSFIGVPIKVGNELLGSIRCFGILKSPYFFGKKDIEVLDLVSSRIAEVWYNWIQYTEFRETKRLWEDVVGFIDRFDGVVLNELNKTESDIKNIYQVALEEISKLFKTAEILDVRLVEKNNHGESQFLRFETIYGNAWHSGSDKQIQARLLKKFPIFGENATSGGAEVYRTGKVKLLDPITKEDNYDATFEETKRMIIAPLVDRGVILGVLDIRSTQEEKFHPAVVQAICLIAQQLAVYNELVRISNQLKSEKSEQVRISQTIAHQLRNPINAACTYARILQITYQNPDFNNTFTFDYLIDAVVGLCNKAYSVASNLRLFSELSKKEPITLNKSRVSSSVILKLLKQAAKDNYCLSNPKHGKKFYINEESFYALDKSFVEFDKKMLIQIIDILFDNAIKYSYPDTTTNVYGEIKSDTFYLSVENEGIKISGRELTLAKVSGWRSEEARRRTPDGNGIGLWVLDNVVRAHGGNLEINPTDLNNRTIIEVSFSKKTY